MMQGRGPNGTYSHLPMFQTGFRPICIWIMAASARFLLRKFSQALARLHFDLAHITARRSRRRFLPRVEVLHAS